MEALARLSEEDPTFRFREDADTGQIIISGMGELHLEVILTRLDREFNVSANAGRPQVVYRETISKGSEAQAVFDREIAGSRQYAMVEVHVAPLARGRENCVVNKIRDDSVPPMYHHAVEAGIRDAFSSGPLLGYPVVDVEAVVYGGHFQENVSTELAFRVAAGMAFRKACEQAAPILLEPYMAVEILTPEEFLGEVLGDLNFRKGRVESITARKAVQVVRAEVPLSKMFGYSTALRSSTQGRATFTMHFSHYDIDSRS